MGQSLDVINHSDIFPADLVRLLFGNDSLLGCRAIAPVADGD